MWSTHTYFRLSFFSFFLQVLLKKCKKLPLAKMHVYLAIYSFKWENKPSSNSEKVEIVFPSWGVGFASFLQIRLCQNVLEVYARKLRCTLWSSVEGKRTDSAFGNCCIHLMIEIGMVIFRYDCFCEAKWLIKQCILRFLRAFFRVYL